LFWAEAACKSKQLIKPFQQQDSSLLN